MATQSEEVNMVPVITKFGIATAAYLLVSQSISAVVAAQLTTDGVPAGRPTFAEPVTATSEPTGPTWSSPNWRPVSGYVGDRSVWYTSESPTNALNRLVFYEHSDDPNHIEIWLEELCHERPCDPGPRDVDLHVGSKEENLRTKEILSAGDDHYIRAIQVCTTDEGDIRKRKIKGARIWTARLEPGGVVVRTDYDIEPVERANCNDHWRERRGCLGNRVAVGLRAYYNDDSPQFNDRYYMTGLELQCAEVEG
jgi:hypothetical protein